MWTTAKTIAGTELDRKNDNRRTYSVKLHYFHNVPNLCYNGLNVQLNFLIIATAFIIPTLPHVSMHVCVPACIETERERGAERECVFVCVCVCVHACACVRAQVSVKQ